MRFKIIHTTGFSYDLPAYESHNEIRLKPLECEHQRLLQFRIASNQPASILEYQDAWGNSAHSISIHPPHDELSVVVESLLDRVPDTSTRIRRMKFSEYLVDDIARSKEQYDFINPSQYVPFSERLRKFFWAARPLDHYDVAEYVTRTIGYIRDQFGYERGTTNVYSNLDHILREGGGVCQDFAHLTLGVLRLAGVPARYVSGYLAVESSRKNPVREQASHAWVEALIPGAGWMGIDPTHGMWATERHLRVAIGRDYADVPPVRGVYRSAGNRQVMTVELNVVPADSEQKLPEGASVLIQQQSHQQLQ